MKNFARTVPDGHRHRDRFRTGHVEMFSATEDGRSNPFEQESVQERREADVEKILERLDERERKIIVQRFGLRRGQEPLTLKQLGATMGVTKERIRQLEARALKKLRQAAQDQRIEVPSLA
jgi:RNA polymerase sigma factor (sigma-70 family)